jgi:ABC-type nitrate/sulfonate/bicarbonate transport system substrate-binding protein
MKKHFKFAAIAAVGVLALSACASTAETADDTTDTAGDTETAEVEERYEITMAMASSDTYTAEWWGWLAAQELGYYDELGVDVTFVAAGGSGAALEQVIAGNADAGNPSAPAFGEAALVGLPVVNVLTYSSGSIFGIFVPEDGPYQTIASMKGANIGISEPGGGEVAFLEAALRAEGIDPITDVQLIPIGDGGPETLAALDNGSVDVYSTAYNDIFAIQTSGVNLLDLTPAIYKEFPARGIITTQETLAEKEEGLKRLAVGTAMGIYFCYENLEACRDMMKGAIPQVFEKNADGISQGDLRFELAIGQVRPADFDRIGQHDVVGTQAFLDLIQSTSADYQAVNAADVLYDGFVDAANDFDRERVAADAAAYVPVNG